MKISSWKLAIRAHVLALADPHVGIPMKVIRIPADGDQRSGIDVISRRSEATLAVGFSKK